MRLADVAARIGAEVEGDPDVEIVGLAPIEDAGPDELTFLANPKYRNLLGRTRAAAVIVGRDEEVAGRPVLRAADPYVAFVAALALFDDRPRPEPGIHPTAVIAASAVLGRGAYVGPYAVVGDDVVVGEDARIHPHVTIYPRVRAGDRLTAHAGAVVRECTILGDDVTLQPGAVIGADGFGFVPMGRERPAAIPQIGAVRLGNGVDVGANSTVDRAAVGLTRLGDGVKLDNLVMVAHGCEIGDGSLLAAQTGIAGSSKLGRGVMAGGQAGVTGHVEIGDEARLSAQAGVIGDVAAGVTVAGYPHQEIRAWRRSMALVRELPDLLRRIRRLEEVLDRQGPGDDADTRPKSRR
jgi:UDP-3-O-[3-hydroxymyristoyl] glucosamine N-acyltransferase